MAALVGLLLAACAGPSAPDVPAGRTVAYLPGLDADVRLPDGAARPTSTGPATGRRVPVVVLVPGGSWRHPDVTGLLPLAQSLADAGVAAVSVTYRGTDDDGGGFPASVADVVCAVDFGAEQVRRSGDEPSPVVVLGHSAGGHLGALAALAPARFRSGCRYPPTAADAFVGLAGAYDVHLLRDALVPFFGVAESADPARWREGDPATWTSRTPLSVLLLHGTADTVVPASVTSTFATRLTTAGHRVTLRLVPGVDHAGIYSSAVAAGEIIAWLPHPSA